MPEKRKKSAGTAAAVRHQSPAPQNQKRKRKTTTTKSPTQPRPRPQSRKRPPATKKAKKGAGPDIGHALLLTGILIAVSAGISFMVTRMEPKKAAVSAEFLPSRAEPEPLSLQEPPPEKKPSLVKPPVAEVPAVVISPQERQVPPLGPPSQKPQPPAPLPKPQPRPQAALEHVPAKQIPEKQVPVKPVPVPQAVPPAVAKAPPEQPSPQPRHQGTLVFIIDDAGNNLAELEPFLRFPGPLTIAVLPGLPHSAEAARRIRAAGKEVFLHQPMEAIGGQAPGPGAIYAGMTSAEVLAILRHNIAEVGPVAGMNNHQGSRITMDRQIMETVLGFCRDRGISFLDSRTTAETAAPAAAQSLGMKIGERNIFIDNDQERPAMNRSITEGLTLAGRKGTAVMIGHTWSPALAPLLTELYQNLLRQGYTLTTASNVIRR